MSVIEIIEHHLERSKRDKKYSNIRATTKKLAESIGDKKSDEWIDSIADVVLKVRNLMTQNVCVFDTETTGFHDTDEIIEFAAIDSLNQDAFIEYRIKPTKPIPAAASNVHGIYDIDLEQCHSFPAMHSQTQDFFSKYSLCVAYNGEFDQRLLKQTTFIHSCPDIVLPEMYDPINDVALFCGTWNKKYNNFKLMKLEGGHRALGDCVQLIKALNLVASLDVDQLLSEY